MSEEDSFIDQLFIDIVKFVFNRYAAGNMPTDQQIKNAVDDYRLEKGSL